MIVIENVEDVSTIEPNSIILGDCLSILEKIPDNSVDMVLVDLPYQITNLSWDSIIPFGPLWDQYNRICKKDAVQVFTASQPFTTTLINSNLKNFKQSLVWDKGKGSNPLLAKKRIMQSHEDIVIFCNGKMPYYPQMEKGEPYKAPRTGGNRTNRITASGKDSEDFRQKDNEGFRYPKSVLKFSIHCGSKLHPTQKPVELMEYLIKTYTKEGDVVLDNTMGSGTTGVACKNTGRKFIGIELLSEYFEIARKRLDTN